MDINSLISKLDWSKEPQGLYAPIAYTLDGGGKRLRPTLALIAADMFGDVEAAVPAALALELFHNYTLMHDDVMDDAPVRRGRDTVHVKWNANTAILSGDQMLIESYKRLEGIPADKLPTVLHLFTKMATEICEGQQYDVDFESRNDVTIPEYIHMIRLKTSVLLGTALHIGAYLAGANEADCQHLYNFGVNLGLAFQIQDDILDVWGDPATFGKQIGGDIIQRKKSMAMLMALNHGSELQLARIDTAYLLTKPASKIAAVTATYDEIGVRDYCEEVMTDYTNQALAELDALEADHKQPGIAPLDTAPLRAIAKQLLSRRS